MKTIVIYDSLFGNTKLVAEAVAAACDAKIFRAGDVANLDLKNVDLLIVGSPTQGGRPTEQVQTWLESLPDLGGTRVAAFDTRFKTKLVGIFGYAADKITSQLEDSNGKLVVPPQGFIVSHTKGPLVGGEIDKAKAWAKQICSTP